MKKFFFLALLLLMLPLAAFCEDYALGDCVLTVENGVVTGFRDANGGIAMDGLYVDVGLDGAFVQNTVGYQRFWDMNTWDLARIVPKNQAPYAPESHAAAYDGQTLTLTHEIEGLTVRLVFSAMDSAVRVTANITSNRSYVSEIQGVHFQLRGIQVPDSATFRFPGNTPSGEFSLSSLKAFAVRQTDYCNPITLTRFDEQAGFNALFLNTEEKWSCGAYRDRDGRMYVSNLAMTEALIASGETVTVGDLYLQTTADDPYAPIQALYKELGYHTPQTGYQSGLLYSCHPAGTMDSGFRDTKTMRAYADSLEGLAQMGVESVWVLPIFVHTSRGVYEPTDQRLIDKRYGDDGDVKCYVDAAHALGINVLFDYVPHGPFPEDQLALDHPEWCSVARSGDKQIEWDCVSFDMASADYQAYTASLIAEHVARFGVDGGRIDCAMGGLSNWKPGSGNRASSSGLKGGQGIVSAIRAGFVSSGKTPLLLPENFHPVPFYAAITDIFYDMPLYRMMLELREKGVDEETFARELIGWLESEHLSSVPGQLKLRFLGNHDTVSWTWDQMRATAVYGEEKAKALWTLMAFIDGVPFLYMGDEDSDLYHFKAGFNLIDFFTELYAARKQYLSDDMDITYLPCAGAAVAFKRGDKLIAVVNLSKSTETYPLPDGDYAVLYGDGTVSGQSAALPAYGSLLLAVK